MTKDIINTVAKNIRENKSYEFIVTTGECIRKMYIEGAKVEDRSLYLIHLDENRKEIKDYFKLNLK